MSAQVESEDMQARGVPLGEATPAGAVSPYAVQRDHGPAIGIPEAVYMQRHDAACYGVTRRR